MRPSAALRLAAAALALAALGGCAVIQEKTLGESFDDAQAGTEIRMRLIAAGGVARFGEVSVEVANRLVLLIGRVPSEEDVIEAERIAWTVASIDEVANELIVDRRNISRDINDNWINSQIRARFLANTGIKGLNYNINVYNGSVYLLGIAETDEELRIAAEEAARVRGVQRVVSYVKMRDRASPPEAVMADSPYGAVEIAPDADTPAPIIPPERQPTQRSQYVDPYAPGSLLPPGAGQGATSNRSGLESAPMAPLVP